MTSVHLSQVSPVDPLKTLCQCGLAPHLTEAHRVLSFVPAKIPRSFSSFVPDGTTHDVHEPESARI